MSDLKRGVNAVLEPPAGTEPVKPEPVVVEPPAGDVIDPVTPEPEIPVDDDTTELEAEAKKRGISNVMRESRRKAQEIADLKRQLEEKNSHVPAAPVSSNVPPVKDELEILAEQMSAEAGDDEYGNKALSVKAAKVVVMHQLQAQYASTVGIRIDSNVAEFVKKNPTAAIYADKIKLELSKLEPGVKDNPINVGRKFKELRGDDADRLIAEAFEQGKKKALEQKKIVSHAAGETPNGLPDGKSAEDMLSADEKHYANKNKISYEDYFKAKGNKRV